MTEITPLFLEQMDIVGSPIRETEMNMFFPHFQLEAVTKLYVDMEWREIIRMENFGTRGKM